MFSPNDPEDVGRVRDKALATGKPTCVCVITDSEIGPQR